MKLDYHDRREALKRGEEIEYQKYRSKAIRVFCVDCMGGHEGYVRDCTDRACALYPFRNGGGNTDETCKLKNMGIRPCN